MLLLTPAVRLLAHLGARMLGAVEGDLMWFMRGLLLDPASLQGQYWPVTSLVRSACPRPSLLPVVSAHMKMHGT